MPSFDMVMRAKPSEAAEEEHPDQAHQTPGPSPETEHDSTSSASPSRLVRSRRRRYLERHPSYFGPASSDLQLHDPLAYDRLIRQHQSAAEREAEGKQRGWASTLEASLVRGEAKLADVQRAAESQASTEKTVLDRQLDWSIPVESESPRDRAQGRWRALIVERFVQGRDPEFDYTAVDCDESLDADDGLEGSWRERRMQDAWFEEEEEGPPGHEGRRRLEGQTGVQDF